MKPDHEGTTVEMLLRGFHLPTMAALYEPTMRRAEAEDLIALQHSRVGFALKPPVGHDPTELAAAFFLQSQIALLEPFRISRAHLALPRERNRKRTRWIIFRTVPVHVNLPSEKCGVTIKEIYYLSMT